LIAYPGMTTTSLFRVNARIILPASQAWSGVPATIGPSNRLVSSVNSPHITIRRMPITAVFGLCAILVVHFFCCIPAMTCRTNADVGVTWILIAPYIAYTFLVLVPLLDDRDRIVFGVSVPVVIAMLLINSAVSANLNSARPHIGAPGVITLIRVDWGGILLGLLWNLPLLILAFSVLLFGSVEYWRKRRTFSEMPGSFQFSMRAMLYLVLWVSLYCGVFTWMIGSHR
jgi:hypothetical protein